jgi:putative acetyltransferase
MRIEIDDLSRPQVLALLAEHLAHMHAMNPPEKVFSLDVDGLRAPGVTFWTVWDRGELLGCGALKELDARLGEVKSMRTPQAARRRGAGRTMLAHIIETARDRGYDTLFLETGSHAGYAPAVGLYEKAGFTRCAAFANYIEDPDSVFMRLRL